MHNSSSSDDDASDTVGSNDLNEIHRTLFAKTNGDFGLYLNSMFGFLRKETDFLM